ncbi:hypothetical protein EVAR_67277_1 [Eumeta japonica]|uniref:Uncharacterized protein n=1 Tax=Eumeta variegata TaxID=151549 RepID=A0A4C1ZX27_EUMVA|nr:hypothetical protein EVAR_67277_1 [Eumeta japonica]
MTQFLFRIPLKCDSYDDDDDPVRSKTDATSSSSGHCYHSLYSDRHIRSSAVIKKFDRLKTLSIILRTHRKKSVLRGDCGRNPSCGLTRRQLKSPLQKIYLFLCFCSSP